MSDVVVLTCPSCGGKLQITADIDRFACAYCGTEQIVKRGDGIVSLAPVVAGLKRVQAGVDKTAAELAISRLTAEIKELEGHLAREANSNWSCASYLLVFAFMLLLIPGFYMLIGKFEFNLNTLFLCGGGLIFAIIGIAIVTQPYNTDKARSIKLEIDRKTLELKRNRSIASK